MMRLLSLAICSLGVWVVLNTAMGDAWVGYVFGGITAVLAFLAAFSTKK